MDRKIDNRGRKFSADPAEDSDLEGLRDLLRNSEAADLRDLAVQHRIGQAIGQAILAHKKQWW